MRLLATLAMLAVASPCLAGAWIGASGSYNTYAMDAVNDDIAGFNQTFAPISMDKIDSGIGFGLSLGVNVERWSFSIGYDRLPASNSIEGSSSSMYDIPANALLGRAAYRLPLNTKIGVLAGLGAGFVSTSGTLGESGEPIAKIGPTTNAVIFEGGAHVSGTTFSWEGFVEGDVPFGGKFSLVPSVGYRAAKVETSAGGGAVSIDQTIDYSGMAARLGFHFAF